MNKKSRIQVILMCALDEIRSATNELDRQYFIGLKFADYTIQGNGFNDVTRSDNKIDLKLTREEKNQIYDIMQQHFLEIGIGAAITTDCIRLGAI